jgi:hypothetical protein
MADYINNVAAGDAYTPACTLGPDFQANEAVLTIANNPALLQFAVGELGNWRWTDEREFFSIPQAFKVGGVIGVKVRNANPGQIARVLAVLAGPGDVEFESGVPFTGQLSATGGVAPTSAVTGHVNAAGAIIAGGGFTVAKLGAGNYQLNFVPILGSTPVLLAIHDNDTGVPVICTVANVAPNIAQVLTWSLAGALTDHGFFFQATPIV